MKDTYVRMRATQGEKEQVTILAIKKGMTVSEYLRHLITRDLTEVEVK